MKELSPLAWFGDRELEFKPPHFVKTSTPWTSENYIWVMSKLAGRFCLLDSPADAEHSIFILNRYFYFEDPKDAMLFELRWAGK
jgi:hypothetical protein